MKVFEILMPCVATYVHTRTRDSVTYRGVSKENPVMVKTEKGELKVSVRRERGVPGIEVTVIGSEKTDKFALNEGVNIDLTGEQFFHATHPDAGGFSYDKSWAEASAITWLRLQGIARMNQVWLAEDSDGGRQMSWNYRRKWYREFQARDGTAEARARKILGRDFDDVMAGVSQNVPHGELFLQKGFAGLRKQGVII